MQIIRMAIFTIILLCTALSAVGQENISVNDKVSELNQKSIALFKIDLTSLKWLLGASPYSYLLFADIEQGSQMSCIKALETHGYAKLEIVNQLPDGSQDGKFLRIVPTAKGQEVIKSITDSSNKSPKRAP